MDLDIVNKILSTSKIFLFIYLNIMYIFYYVYIIVHIQRYYSTYLLHVAILKNVKFHNIMR